MAKASRKGDAGSPGKKPGFLSKLLGLKTRSNSVSSNSNDGKSKLSTSTAESNDSTVGSSATLAKVVSSTVPETDSGLTPSILLEPEATRKSALDPNKTTTPTLFKSKSPASSSMVSRRNSQSQHNNHHHLDFKLKKNLFRRGLESSPSNDKNRHSSYIDDDTDDMYDEDTNTSDDNSSFASTVSRTNSSISLTSIVDQKISMQMSSKDDSTWSGLSYESLLFPRYIKGHRRSKHSPRQFKRLFLAQELKADANKPSEAVDVDDILSKTSSKDADNSAMPNNNNSNNKDNKDIVGDQTLGENEQHEVFIMKFSTDGNYLATAGRDAVVRIWKVISSPLGRLEYQAEQKEKEKETASANGSNGMKSGKKSKTGQIFPYAPVFRERPIREFKGHTKGVLTLDWSKNNFLVSGSMDKTARLWHVDRLDCLEVFEHDDFVTSVRFHPTDDRFFLSGSLDNEVRLWSILERNVAYSRNLGSDVLITTSEFTPDGSYCLVGGFNGCVFALETKGLHVSNTFVIKSRSFVNFHTRSYKITGIEIFDNVQAKAHDDPLTRYNILVSTNDSKIRLLSSSLKTLITRFKGLSNQGSSIAASMSEDRKYVVSGSEDSWVYIWENSNSIVTNRVKLTIREILTNNNESAREKINKHYHGTFMRSAKSLAGKKMVRKLKLPNLIENSGESYVANENSSYYTFHAHTSRVNCAIFAPSTTQKLLQVSDDMLYDLVRRAKQCSESSYHKMKVDTEKLSIEKGYIIITTDNKGLIRVFRQDVAYPVRNTLRQMLRKTETDMDSLTCRSIIKSKQSRPSRNLSPSMLRLKTRNGSSNSLVVKEDVQSPIRSPVRQSSFREKVYPFLKCDSKSKIERSLSPLGTPQTLHDSAFHYQQLNNEALHSTFQNLKLEPTGRSRGREMH